MIKNTRVFKEFEKSFNHFFDECERGFTNELIITMHCRLYPTNRQVIGFKANIKEMFFIKQGVVEVINPESDTKTDVDRIDTTSKNIDQDSS